MYEMINSVLGNYRGTLEGTSQSEFLQQIELTKQTLLIGP